MRRRAEEEVRERAEEGVVEAVRGRQTRHDGVGEALRNGEDADGETRNEVREEALAPLRRGRGADCAMRVADEASWRRPGGAPADDARTRYRGSQRKTGK